MCVKLFKIGSITSLNVFTFVNVRFFMQKNKSKITFIFEAIIFVKSQPIQVFLL